MAESHKRDHPEPFRSYYCGKGHFKVKILLSAHWKPKVLDKDDAQKKLKF
ncbi:MAG: hypothetical protein QW782_01750 [Candidatus Bathyarchaeia archaeon]